MEKKYTVLTADIAEIKSLPSAHYIAYEVSHDYAMKVEKLLDTGADPNHMSACVIIPEIKK